MILIGNKTPESITIGGKDVASIAINNETVWTSSQEEPVDDPVVTCVDNVVTMTCSTSGATINYSTDGGTTYSVYSTPITISATTNYTVYASKARMSDSNIVTYTATFKETVATPVVSCTDNVVTMSCSTNGATIHYSTNGGSSYSVYSSPITISANTTYTVYATKSGMFDSSTTTYTATFKQTVATPVVSCTNNVVTMTCATNGATIKYSTNGGSSYSTYSGTITISANTTYTVYATKSGMFDSATTTYTATYKGTVAKPTVSCSNNVVTMSCSTSGATIKYSTNGGSSYSTYSSPITISATTNYTVYATKSGMFDSATTTYKATYVTPKLDIASVVKTSGRTYNYNHYATLRFTTGSGSSAVSGVTYYVNWSYNSSVTNPTTTNYDYKLEGTGTNSEVSQEFGGDLITRVYIKVLSVKSGYINSDILSADFRTG